MRMMTQELPPQLPKKLLYISVDLLECLVWYIVFRRSKMCDSLFSACRFLGRENCFIEE